MSYGSDPRHLFTVSVKAAQPFSPGRLRKSWAEFVALGIRRELRRTRVAVPAIFKE